MYQANTLEPNIDEQQESSNKLKESIKMDMSSTNSLNKIDNDLSIKNEMKNSTSSLSFNSTKADEFSSKMKNTESNSSINMIMNNQSVPNQNAPLNEKVANLASSIYTELEKIVKLHGRDTVKDLMSIVVNVLEALDTAYQDKEELIVENELLKDDYEKLLNQYEREKQIRKDTELKLFQGEDSFAEQKKEYDEKIKSLESIVRMIDLKSKNTSDHVMRLEEKENELKKEYNKLHERYTELFKNHCDYMERTKILFGNDNRFESNTVLSSNPSKKGVSQQQQQTSKGGEGGSKLLDVLKTSSLNINRNELINALKSSTRTDISIAINNLLIQDTSPNDSTTVIGSSSSSLSSLSAQSNKQQSPEATVPSDFNNPDEPPSKLKLEKQFNEVALSTGCLLEDSNAQVNANKLNLHSSENFDEHLSSNCTEFDDNNSDMQSLQKQTNDSENDFEGDDEGLMVKNDLSLFNELSRENYDITELDDGADLTGMTREVANLIRENSELLQTKHALNVLKDDLIARLDQFTNEMVILREEIDSLQTVKACLQLRITELEEEAKKTREELMQKSKKQEDEDESVPISQRKRFTRAEMARVLMERNQYKEKLMDLQEAVRWTEMMRASKVAQPGSDSDAHHSSQINYESSSSSQPQDHKKKTTLFKFFSDLFGSSSQSQGGAGSSSSTQTRSANQTSNPSAVSPSSSKSATIGKSQNAHEQVVPSHESMEKVTKAYEFLKEDQTISKSSAIKKDKPELQFKEEGRVQAYGWSLPSKSSQLKESTSKAGFSLSVPVPVYCRPLFEQDNNLKLSCATTIDLTFDRKLAENCDKLIDSSIFSHFRSTKNPDSIKSSCIWICNLNENDSHVSILDANKPGDLVTQFTLKNIKIHTIQSVSGASQNELPSADESATIVNEKKANVKEYSVNQVNQNLENINYIEIENEEEKAVGQSSQDDGQNDNKNEPILTSMYPTMWLGSQEGYLFIHSSISNVSHTIDKVKLKDAILCIVQNKQRVIVGLADGSAAIFKRNHLGSWDLKNFQLINFDRPHHSIRCISNVDDTVWCGCRNKIFVLNPFELKILTVIEVHPRKENQVRHIVSTNNGVWVSIRLDSTLRLYHAKTYQHLQYLDIDPFVTRMLGTSNLGLSLIRISSLVISSKRLWIGTGNGVILSIPFTDNLKTESKTQAVPGQVVRVDNTSNQDLDKSNLPYCDITDTQFSFHGHRDAIKFFLNVPSEIIQKSSAKHSDPKADVQYEKVETNLILSGGHGYIDFRIGDQESSSAEKQPIDLKEKIQESSQFPTANSKNKNDRSHLIVWQINNYN